MPDFQTNRRQFLERASYLPFAGAIALPTSLISNLTCRYVCSPADSTIQVFSKNDKGWTAIQSLSSNRAAASARHPQKPVLYVANQLAEYGGLPRGTVETYAVDPRTGRLAFVQRTPLSLSATAPRSVAVSPDGQHLVVAAFEGGVYNVFALAPDGELRQLTGIFKELGCGLHPVHQASAHPHSVIFDAAGHVISSDFGCDRLNVFSIEDGQMIRKRRLDVPAGSGPGALTLNSEASRLSVHNELSRSASSFAYNSGFISSLT